MLYYSKTRHLRMFFPPVHHIGDNVFECLVCNAKMPAGSEGYHRCEQSISRYVQGVGDNLHDLIVKFTKESPKGGCGCEQLIAEMNRWGPEGCRKRMEEIVDHMMNEADKRKWKLAKWPGTRTGAKLLVRWAIRRMEKETEERVII